MVMGNRGGTAYHDQKAIMKPNHEKKKTLPYLLNGLRIGIDRALPLTGLISGACQRVAMLNPMTLARCFGDNSRCLGKESRVLEMYLKASKASKYLRMESGIMLCSEADRDRPYKIRH